MLHRDELTGLLNHGALMAELEYAVEYGRRHGGPLAFVVFDLDRFGEVHERFGQIVGDQILLHVANVFRSNVRASDVIGRYGGEEFAMILRGAGADGRRRPGRQAPARARRAGGDDGGGRDHPAQRERRVGGLSRRRHVGGRAGARRDAGAAGRRRRRSGEASGGETSVTLSAAKGAMLEHGPLHSVQVTFLRRAASA